MKFEKKFLYQSGRKYAVHVLKNEDIHTLLFEICFASQWGTMFSEIAFQFIHIPQPRFKKI